MTIDEARPRRLEEVDSPRPAAIRPEVHDAIRRQVGQALQPVLAEFRQQAVETVRQQLDQVRRTEIGKSRQRGAPPADEVQAPAADEAEAPPADEAQAPPADEAQAPPADEAEAEERALAREDDPETGRAAEPAEATTSQSLVSSAAEPLTAFIEQLGAQWIRSLVDNGRDAACSEPVRAGVREQVENLVAPLLRVVLELVTGKSARRELQQESERTVDEIVNDALDYLCSERVLTDVQRQGEIALRSLAQGDVAATLQAVWEAVRTVLQVLVGVLGDQWERVLHLVIDLLLTGAKHAVGTMLKEGLGAISIGKAGEKAGSAGEQVKDKGQELKERLTERLETLQERVSEEVGKLKERVADGLQSVVKEGIGGDKFGRPPTGRPPSLRAPSGRPPTGGPPSTRPPSGRPPSLTRRGA